MRGSGLSARERRALREVRALIDRYSLSTDTMADVPTALRRALRVDRAIIYSAAERDQRVWLDLVHEDGFPPNAVAVFQDWVARENLRLVSHWREPGGSRVDQFQRDRVLDDMEIKARVGAVGPVEREVYPLLGMAGARTFRALVCDDDGALGYVGAFGDSLPTIGQRRLMTMIVDPLRRRLAFENRIRRHATTSAALEVVMEEASAPTYLLSESRAVLHVNRSGRESLDADSRATHAKLRAAIAGCESTMKATALENAGRRVGWVVSERAGAARQRAMSARRTAEGLGLTAAQSRVFARLIRGDSNVAIAAELGIAERTVETHVTAILAKARVSSRAALIASLYDAE